MIKFRKHIRLKGFDYSEACYYFVTICTRNRQEIFEPRVSGRYGHKLPDFVVENFQPQFVAADSQSAEGEADQGSAATRLTDLVVAKLDQLPRYYPAEIDFYVIMPDHIHFILAMRDTVAAESNSARSEGASRMRGYKKTPLSQIIRSFKSWITREVGRRIFQPNYYEHIIRSEGNLDYIRNYIFQNPWVEYQDLNWKLLDPSM